MLVAPVLAQADLGATISQFLPLILLGAAFYFLLIRPQQKRAKAQRQLLSSVGIADRVVTIGGLHGTVRMVDEDTVHLEVATGTIVTFAKASIARRIVDADAGAEGGVEGLDDGVGDTGAGRDGSAGRDSSQG